MVTHETSAVANGGEFLPCYACGGGLFARLQNKGSSQDGVSWQPAGERKSPPQPLKIPSLQCQFLHMGEFKEELLSNRFHVHKHAHGVAYSDWPPYPLLHKLRQCT